jgi:hypothetical protein
VCVGDGISDGVGVEFGVVIGKCVWDTVIYADADINGFTEWVSNWICNTHTVTHGDTIWNLERLAVFFGHANAQCHTHRVHHAVAFGIFVPHFFSFVITFSNTHFHIFWDTIAVIFRVFICIFLAIGI